MKVIFLQDVPNVARAGEVRVVADGYARNYLVPRKLAVVANLGATRTLEMQKQIKEHREAQNESEMRELAKKLEGKEVHIKAKAGAKDQLYGSITNADIATTLEKADGIIIDKRKIELAEPIRQLGTHEVEVKLAKDITARLRINVLPEEEVEKTSA